MRVVVQYTAQARQAAGHDQELLELSAPLSLGRLFQFVCERHGPAMERILLGEDRQPHAAVAVFVNDSQVNSPEAAQLADGDRVLILCPMSGG